ASSFHCRGQLRALHSFPTRRSSDLSRIELVLDAVEARHQHGGKAEIGIAQRIGEADLDALGLRVGGVGNAAGGRAVARRVSEQRSEEHTSELQSRFDLVCRLLLEKK